MNYNAGDALTAVVVSLGRAKDDGLIQSFWVLDNASADGSFDEGFIELHGGHSHRFRTNIGFGRAMNFAIRANVGADILLVNPDAELFTPGLAAMCRALSTATDIAAISGALQTPEGAFRPSAFPEPDLLWAVSHLLRLKQSRAARRIAHHFPAFARKAEPYVAASAESARDVDWLVGACVLLKAEAIRSVGLFDEQFFLYFEEIDWCKRARAAGWRVRYLPDPVARHAVGVSASTAPALASWARYRSMTLYFRKHHGAAQAGLVRALGVLVAVSRVVLTPRQSISDRAALWAFLGGGAGRWI